LLFINVLLFFQLCVLLYLVLGQLYPTRGPHAAQFRCSL